MKTLETGALKQQKCSPW